MALSDLAVFSEYAYSAMTEVQAQQIDLFNGAAQGVISLSQGAHQGDYSDKVFFAKIAGIVKRRNPYGTGAQTNKVMAQLIDTMVKVAAGSVPVDLSPGQFNWIQMNPKEAGAAFGQQLAGDSMADMLNTGISASAIAIANQSALTNDGTGTGTGLDFLQLNSAASKFGDRANDIAAWVIHSTPMFNLYKGALTNAQQLFRYNTVNVVADAFGRLFVITDAPGLTYTSSGTKFRTLGLVPGAVMIDQNNDFVDNFDTRNGDENITSTYQSQWSFELGIKGFTWNKTGGGHAPTDSTIQTASNWTKIATSIKDMAGVVALST